MNDIDLIVSSVRVPLYVTLNETIPLSWTVKNLGTDSAFANWDEGIYVSDDQLFDYSDTLIANRDPGENTPLASGSSYTLTQDIYIPSYVVTGDRYLLFVTNRQDFSSNQDENDETNNVFAQAITVIAPDVDLVVTAANAPTTVTLGQNIDLFWTVTNLGTDPASGDWYDSVYISDDQFLDNSDDYLDGYSRNENTPLAFGGSYTVTKNIYILPYFADGDRYLLFVANAQKLNGQSETNETNNVFAKAITVNAPDLVITAADAPSTINLSEVISVSWIVTNQGTGSALAKWYDAVYISDDQFFDYEDIQIRGSETAQETPLAVGGSYKVTQNISLDYGTGDRYLLFVTNTYPYQGETNETNNVFAQAITINAPDLVITAVNAPTSAALGETISVSWTVKNQGTVSASANGYDAVYISNDQFFDRRRDIFLGQSYIKPPLASGDSYTNTIDATLSTYLVAGEKYLLFVTDRGFNQGETNETNNVFVQAISLQAITLEGADLVVTAANAPSAATLNETISLSWTIENQGTFSASSSVYTIYISDDQFFEYGDTYIGGGQENTPLAVGGSYTLTQDIYLPNRGTGDVYLLFITDGDNDTNKTNNVFAKAITLTAPDVDLVITAANVPTSAVLGETISVSWIVKNQGTVSASANWYDAVYISDDQFLDSSDTKILEDYKENRPLASGGSYTVNKNISLGSYLAAGDRYLLFITDGGYQGNRQSESNETNNVFAQAITINAPDLVITAANAPTTAAVSEIISVSFTVTNQSTVSLLGQWFNAVYFSYDKFLDEEDTQLMAAVTQENTFLDALDSFTITQDIYLGRIRPTEGYLLFVTDDRYYGNNVSESNETNNVFAQAITLTAPDVDLVVRATAPTTATVGDPISVSWTVTNQGTGSALREWYDDIYISNDPILDTGDTQIARRGRTPLAGGRSYTVTQDISLDYNLRTGDRFLLFVTDIGYYQAETNEYNNLFAKRITINARDVDLVVTTANAPTTATVNELISVSWTVKNQGTDSTLSQWFDGVYISNDQFFDSSDFEIAGRYREQNTPLAGGSSYTVTQDIYLNSNVGTNVGTGDRYLLFVTDAGFYGNNQSETETNKTNNVLAKAITINTPDVDLVVTAANAPTYAVLGETISVFWTVKNQGTVSALANWYDYIYVSDDQSSNFGYPSIYDRYAEENTPLAAGGSYTVTQDIHLDSNLVAGDRYLSFVTDEGFHGTDQSETNETNNFRAVAISLYAQDQVFNGTPGRDTLIGNDSNNLITGLQGADTLTGGAGSDRFVYTSIRDAGDTITDFVAGTDKIDLTKLLQSFSLDSLNYETATTQGYLSFGTVLSNTTVLIDIDGTAGRARPTQLLTVQGLSQSTLAQSDNFLL